MTTEQLIKNCLNHEKSAQKELVVLFGGYLMTICRRYIRDRHYAEDVCQNAFIKIFNKMHQYDSSRGEFKSWMCKITINCALEFLRSKKHSFQDLDKVKEPSSSANISMSQLLQEDLLKMMGELSTIQRTIFNLVEIEGYKHQEVAELLNINASTCRSHLHRAKKLLSARLEAYRYKAI